MCLGIPGSARPVVWASPSDRDLRGVLPIAWEPGRLGIRRDGRVLGVSSRGPASPGDTGRVLCRAQHVVAKSCSHA